VWPLGKRTRSRGWRRTAAAALAVDPRDDRGVEADSGSEDEPPVIGPAQADGATVTGSQCVKQDAGRLDWVIGQTERPREYIGGATRDHAQGRDAIVHTVGEQTVHDFVDGAVAAEGDHRVGAVAHGPAGQRRRVPPIVGLFDLQLGRAGQRTGKNIAFVRGRGGRARIDNDEYPHGCTVPG
jgi:hypothetical protein